MRPFIALLDDDPQIRELYAMFLKEREFDVGTFESPAVLDDFLRNKPVAKSVSAFVLDISMPGDTEAGLHYCQRLRQRFTHTPIVVMSALDATHDLISAYRMGADDYLVKGDAHGPDLLVAVIHAHLRRVQEILSSDRHFAPSSANPLRHDADKQVMYWDDEVVELSLQEYQLVACLMAHTGHAVSPELLMKSMGTTVEPETIAIYMRRARKAFLHIDPDFSSIQTIRGQGYLWRDP